MANRTVFVGDLSSFVTEAHLMQVFSRCGPISSIEIKRSASGDSLMHGFIKFLQEDAAVLAVRMYHDQKFIGRRMVVNSTNTRAPKKPYDQWHKLTLHFTSFRADGMDITEEVLDTLCSRFGEVQDTVVRNHAPMDASANNVHGHSINSFGKATSAFPNAGHSHLKRFGAHHLITGKEIVGYAVVFFAQAESAQRAFEVLHHQTVEDIVFQCSISAHTAVSVLSAQYQNKNAGHMGSNHDTNNRSVEPTFSPSNVNYNANNTFLEATAVHNMHMNHQQFDRNHQHFPQNNSNNNHNNSNRFFVPRENTHQNNSDHHGRNANFPPPFQTHIDNNNHGPSHDFTRTTSSFSSKSNLSIVTNATNDHEQYPSSMNNNSTHNHINTSSASFSSSLYSPRFASSSSTNTSFSIPSVGPTSHSKSNYHMSALPSNSNISPPSVPVSDSSSSFSYPIHHNHHNNSFYHFNNTNSTSATNNAVNNKNNASHVFHSTQNFLDHVRQQQQQPQSSQQSSSSIMHSTNEL